MSAVRSQSLLKILPSYLKSQIRFEIASKLFNLDLKLINNLGAWDIQMTRGLVTKATGRGTGVFPRESQSSDRSTTISWCSTLKQLAWRMRKLRYRKSLSSHASKSMQSPWSQRLCSTSTSCPLSILNSATSAPS
jgi:hypothetical protein